MLPPRKPDTWPPELETMQDTFASRLGIYHTMAHHPDLLKAWASLRDHVVLKNVLGPVRSEVTILRTGHRLGALYEWDHHVMRARDIGMSDTRIASLRGPLSGMIAEDTTIARAVDELFDAKRLSPDTQNALRALVGTEGVLDVMATVGFYSTLGYIANTFEIEVDPDVAQQLAANPLAD